MIVPMIVQTTLLGKKMMNALFRLTVAAAAMATASAVAMAADMDVPPPPPPVDDLRPASYDWTGPYVGAFAGFSSIDGHYDKVPDCPPGAPPAGCQPVDPEMSGSAFTGGLLVGYNYDLGGAVIGAELDWASTMNHIAQNRDPAEQTHVDFDNIITLRARAGKAMDRTLLYLTGGVAFVDATFEGLVGDPTDPTASGMFGESKWITGWTVGGGIEHAFTDNVHARLEYLYVGLPDADFRLEDPNGFGGDVTQHFDAMHIVRAALTYNFTW
jgi:outer membrane immunogenic protein